MNFINIVLSVDDNYVKPMCVTIRSLIANTKYPQSQLQFYVLYEELTSENKQSIEHFFNSYQLNLYMQQVNLKVQEKFSTSGHITLSAYYRLFAPNIFSELQKFLYLDCDLIVETDIVELYEQDLEGYIVGAVTDFGGFHRCEALGITNGRYFNSGVLLVDAQKWRSHNITEKMLNYISENPHNLEYHDQDALNACLSTTWYELNNKWNKQTLDYMVEHRNNSLVIKSKEEAIKHKGIAHFTSAYKPWNIYCPHPLRDEYRKYYKQCGFKTLLPIEVFEQHHKVNQEPCIIFGTGGLAESFLSTYPYLNVSYYLDNNSRKHGTIYFDVPVRLPHTIPNLKAYKIYICSSYHNEIKEQLETMGLIESLHFFKI